LDPSSSTPKSIKSWSKQVLVDKKDDQITDAYLKFILLAGWLAGWLSFFLL
jgi:hypothetical protein